MAKHTVAKAKVAKATKSKSKRRGAAKTTRAQIEKLNQDAKGIAAVHTALARATPQKQQKSLDASQLKEDLKKDEEVQKRSAAAESDLAKQLEVLTGMAL